MTPLTIFLQLSCFALAVLSIPFSKPRVRDVVTPPVTNPNTKTVWVVGQVETVTWATAGLPPPENITNIYGELYLGYLLPGSDNENVNFSAPLATGFNITSGAVNITVPDVVPRDSYILILFGDSGDRSDEFTITNVTTTSTTSKDSSSTTKVSSSTSKSISASKTVLTSETVISGSITSSFTSTLNVWPTTTETNNGVGIPSAPLSSSTATSPAGAPTGAPSSSSLPPTISGSGSSSSSPSSPITSDVITSPSSSATQTQTTTTSTNGALSRNIVSQASFALVPMIITLCML